MKYSICLFFTLFTLMAFGQGTTSFVGIGAKLQMDSTSLPKTTAAKIIEFTPDGSALNSGLKTGDLITKIDGRKATGIPLKEVIAMIVGEQGTSLTIEVSRSGSLKTYVLERKKIANGGRHNPAISSDFCNGMSAILNDAAYRFENVTDNTKPADGGFACKIKVPGVESIVIKNSDVRSCYLDIGKYQTTDEVNTAAERIISNLKTCFPDYYYLPQSKGESTTIQIGQNMKDGRYNSASMILYSWLEDDVYHLQIRINEGVEKLFLPISTASNESEFALAIRKIYDDVNYDFRNIKGTEHIVDDFFTVSTWYDLNFTVPEAAKAFINEGSAYSPEECIAQFFLGEKAQAAETFTKFADVMYKSLGSEFVYSYDKPDGLPQMIPSSAENVLIFAIKKERAGESIPVIAMINEKQADGRYLIYLSFHKTVY